MFKRKAGFVAWTAGFIVTLGVAAGASAVVPSLINAEEAPPAVTSPTVDVAATVEAPPAVVAAAAADAPAPEVTIPEIVVPEPETAVVAPPTTKAKAAAPKIVVPTPVVEAPAPVIVPAPPAITLAPRTVPSAAQVQSAIAGISGLVQLPLFFQISPANVADVGNKVCTAFDQGQTFAQVKAVGLAQVAAYVPVSPAAADYAVRTAVSMYCPAYASKLV